MKNIDKECPLEEGEITITRDVELPQQIPPVSHPPFLFVVCLLHSLSSVEQMLINNFVTQGTFNVEADVYTKDDEKITCLQATINFGKKNEL